MPALAQDVTNLAGGRTGCANADIGIRLDVLSLLRRC